MQALSIEGGASLRGEIGIDGAKNAALPACCAALLTDEPVILHRVPQLRDVSTILYMLSALGKRVVRHDDNVSIASSGALSHQANAYSVKQMRASFLVLGPLAARLGRASVPLPGGCVIGTRPVDLHLDGLQTMGARIKERPGLVEVEVDRFRGAHITLPFPSVGATEQLLMTACLAKGETQLDNAAIEPEVCDLVRMLCAMGAEIEQVGRTFRVAGKPTLQGAQHALLPDRLEAGTILLAAVITKGDVRVSPVIPQDLETLTSLLEQTGATVEATADSVRCQMRDRPTGVHVKTLPFPGFPTDLHPPVAALLAIAKGTSTIEETVFERRFAYTEGLSKMGARMLHDGSTLTIQGVPTLRGAVVEAPDLRGGAAQVLAGLAAEGRTTITEPKHIDRGYARIEQKLSSLGATIERRENHSNA